MAATFGQFPANFRFSGALYRGTACGGGCCGNGEASSLMFVSLIEKALQQ